MTRNRTNDEDSNPVEQPRAERPVQSEPSPRHPVVRRSFVLGALAVAAAVVGYYSGHWMRARSVEGRRRDASLTEASLPGTLDAPRPEAVIVNPESPLPPTAEALIQEARRVVKQLVEAFPDAPDALEMEARLKRWLGDSQGAVAIWKRCLEMDPDYVHAYVGMASAAAERGDHDQAVRLAEKAVQLAPGNFQARAVLANALIQLGRPAEAVPVLEEFVKGDPRSLGFFYLGRAHFQLKQYEKAKEYYEAAVRKYPDYTEAYYGLGQAYAKLGDEKRAKAAMEKFRTMSAPERMAKRVRGVVVSDLEVMYQEAAVLYVDAGRVYFVAGKSDQAETIWLRAAQLDVHNIDARQSLAFLCRRAGRLGETIGWLSEAAELDPHNPSYYVEIGRLCEQLSGPGAAEHAFRKACAAAPTRAAGYAALADLLLRYEHKLPEALSLAQKAVQYDPAASHYAMLAAARRANGDAAGALEAIEKAIRLAPNSASYRAVRDAIKAEL